MRGSSPREFGSIPKSAPIQKKRIPKLTKQIKLDIDFQSTNPLYCEFMRADKLQFNITYKNVVYPDTALKLRVFCYMKNGGYAFGDEFENIDIATFDSTRTAKYSGYGTITIQLIDDEENLINSANVICKIIESNSTTPFVVSPDFAQESKREIQAIVDEGKDQIAIATKEAKQEIDSWTDQSQRIANAESNIASLQMFKANSGALHFTSGSYAMCSQNVGLPKVFSLCRTFAFTEADWNAIKSLSSGYFDYNYFNVTTEGTGYNGYALRNNGGDLVFYVSYNGVIAISMVISNAIVKTYLDGKEHRLCVCSDGGYVKLYIDGVLIKSATGNLQDVATGRSAFTYRPIGKYLDIYHFNFDMTSADAPYTIADYQQGKPIPPSALSNTILALENYSVKLGSAKKILDYSGNNNDATITGDVKGDNDNRVQKLIDFIKS